MSRAKKAVDSTLKRILIYTAEIIASIILLIIICLPLVFAVPMWIQQVAFGTPTSQLAVNPVAWFGMSMAMLIILGLGSFSFLVGYFYVSKLLLSEETAPVPPTSEMDEEEETDEEVSDELDLDDETE